MIKFRELAFTLALLCGFASPALATNGMLIEGYGPISQAMGGTSMAFDNGNGAMANNPATLALMPEGNRFDLALGFLMPSVKFKMPNKDYKSDSTLFMMPAVGYVKRQGDWSFGVGMYSQGGMGTDYMDDLDMFSQVIIGKLILPVTYSVTDKLSFGATLEYVQMDMDLVMGPFDFKNNSNFSGSSSGWGVTGKLGAVYKFNDYITIGGAYQHKGGVGDLTGHGARVKGLDVPATASVGVAVNATDKLMLTADYKRIFWSQSMKTISISQNNIEVDMKQNWKDQNVLALGVAYKVLPQLTLRAGANIANNPIEENVTPLFPAIIKNHYTAGVGYEFNETHSIDASFAYAPKVTRNNGSDFAGTSTSHSQKSGQLMYSFKF